MSHRGIDAPAQGIYLTHLGDLMSQDPKNAPKLMAKSTPWGQRLALGLILAVLSALLLWPLYQAAKAERDALLTARVHLRLLKMAERAAVLHQETGHDIICAPSTCTEVLGLHHEFVKTPGYLFEIKAVDGGIHLIAQPQSADLPRIMLDGEGTFIDAPNPLKSGRKAVKSRK